MAFPLSAILDDFNRADANPAGGSWTGVTSFGVGDVQIVSNTLKGVANAAGGCFAYWNTIMSGADAEAYCTIPTLPATNEYLDIGIRCVDMATAVTIDGYNVRLTKLSGTDTIVMNRIVNGALTALHTTNQEVSAGDSIGISAIGSTISYYYKASAGAWTLLGSVTDTTYTAAGYNAVGIGGTAPSVAIDDFGGGVVKPLDGTTSVTLTPSSGLDLTKPLAGTVPLTLAPTGGLTVLKRLRSTFGTTLAVTGALDITKTLEGTSDLLIGSTSLLSIIVNLIGATDVTLTPAAALLLEVPLDGSTSVLSGLVGELTVVPASGADLDGTTSISLATIAELTLEKLLQGDATLLLGVQAALSVVNPNLIPSRERTATVELEDRGILIDLGSRSVTVTWEGGINVGE